MSHLQLWFSPNNFHYYHMLLIPWSSNTTQKYTDGFAKTRRVRYFKILLMSSFRTATILWNRHTYSFVSWKETELSSSFCSSMKAHIFYTYAKPFSSTSHAYHVFLRQHLTILPLCFPWYTKVWTVQSVDISTSNSTLLQAETNRNSTRFIAFLVLPTKNTLSQ